MIGSDQLLTQLNWRYATKNFDPNKKLTADQLDLLLETLRLSPSSFGIQGRGFVVVENPALRQQLLPYAWNQKQVVDASHLLVLCRRTDVNTDFIRHYIQITAQNRGVSIDTLDGFSSMLLGFLEGKDQESLAIRLTKQVYIAQGFLLSACAQLGIDSCPMEGFDTQKFDEILGLADYNLASCVIVPVGFRSSDDKYAHMSKNRFSKQEVIFTK